MRKELHLEFPLQTGKFSDLSRIFKMIDTKFRSVTIAISARMVKYRKANSISPFTKHLNNLVFLWRIHLKCNTYYPLPGLPFHKSL